MSNKNLYIKTTAMLVNDENGESKAITKKSYFYKDRSIPKSKFDKIAKGKWARLDDDVILKKLDRIEQKRERVKAYREVYEETLSTPIGQYSLGIAQEKVCNKVDKLLKDNQSNNLTKDDLIALLKKHLQEMRNNGRRIIKRNKDKLKAQ